MLVFSGIMSCTQDDSVLNRGDKDLELEMERMIEECGKHGECLPNVTVTCTASVIKVKWSTPSFTEKSNPKLELTYFVNGHTYNMYLYETNGEMDIPLSPFCANYSFYYSLRCQKCAPFCTMEWSVPIKGGNLGGQGVNHADCLKEYYLYTARLSDPSTLELWRKDYSVPDPYDYIELNAGRVHIGAGYSGVGERCEELTVTRNDTNRVVTVHRLPYESGKTCRIELYNKDACPETDKHYVYIVYYCNPMTGQIEIQQGPTERNGHNGLS